MNTISDEYHILMNKLKDLGIDTTLHHYELQAEEYDRYGATPVYTFKFTAPGDYLAYFSMVLHRKFSKQEVVDLIDDYWGDDIPESVAEIKDFASQVWYGDGDDYIIYLKNLDTGETLYEGYYEPEEDEYEEESSWED